MLDTNVVSELVRRPDGEAARKAAALEPRTLAVSIIVAAELRYGAERRRSARLTRQLEAILAALVILPLAQPADAHYAAIRSELERAGRTIGHNDLLIAAHARALDLTLVTRNVREFERVSGLVVEDWQTTRRPS
ncbi:MAG: type II toxin-antitoxin system VapC family toxin [Acidobacteria bacterium]|nr:type II toxin-antitoxin system VapC family toxin [Acidobacteriota bacterium]